MSGLLWWPATGVLDSQIALLTFLEKTADLCKLDHRGTWQKMTTLVPWSATKGVDLLRNGWHTTISSFDGIYLVSVSGIFGIGTLLSDGGQDMVDREHRPFDESRWDVFLDDAIPCSLSRDDCIAYVSSSQPADKRLCVDDGRLCCSPKITHSLLRINEWRG